MAFPVCFAIFMSREVHSLTCVKLPGVASTRSECIDCMESMIRTFESLLWAAASIFSILVSARSIRSSGISFNLAERYLICLSDSSPVIYRGLEEERPEHICSIRVDLPIPGSPPMSIIDPGTIPPPRTLSNSVICVLMRNSLSVGIELRVCISGAVCLIGFNFFEDEEVTVSSTRESHAPQEEHLPCHLGDRAPHWLQTNMDFVFIADNVIKIVPKMKILGILREKTRKESKK